MKLTRKPIVVKKLVDTSAQELHRMTTDICVGGTQKDREDAKVSPWRRRFAASGKRAPAPKLRVR